MTEKKPLLYRGTNDFDLEARKKQGFYYGALNEMGRKYFTSTTTDLMSALISGNRRCEDIWHSQNKAKPVLIAIRPENYAHSMSFGLETNEFVIDGKIDFNDVIEFNSIDKLLESCPSALQEKIDYFKDYYLRFNKK